MSMSTLINQIETAQLRKNIPDFRPGDTVVVQVKVIEGNRKRLQAFEGIVIAKRNRGLNSAFTVRKISSGEGVERVFQTHSPLIDNIKVKRRGDVRQAKLYYLRELSGRAARIKEKLKFKETGSATAASMDVSALEAAAEEAVKAQAEEEKQAQKVEQEKE